MGNYLRFESEILKSAWKRSWTELSPEVRHVPRYVYLYVCGSVGFVLIRETDDLVEEIISALAFGPVALPLALVGLLVWNIFAEPYRMYAAGKEVERTLSEEVGRLKQVHLRNQSRIELAKELEEYWERGQDLLNRWGDVTVTIEALRRWYDQTVGLVSRISEAERSSYKTVAAGPPGTLKNMEHERVALMSRLAKVRLIISRLFAEAEGTN
jgi:hypothetical protein